MEATIAWVQANWTNILAVWGAVVGLATIVVKLTPTPKDDAILSKIVGFVSKFSTVKKP